MVKRILALSLLMVGLVGCGSGGGAESELATESTISIGVEGATACHRQCASAKVGYICMGSYMRVRNCEAMRSIYYADCVSGCADKT